MYIGSVASILPNQWQGERGCVVGPFSNRLAANAFILYVLQKSHVPTHTEDLFVRENAYYIRVGATLVRELRIERNAARRG